jgi:hypothetical protein
MNDVFRVDSPDGAEPRMKIEFGRSLSYGRYRSSVNSVDGAEYARSAETNAVLVYVVAHSVHDSS